MGARPTRRFAGLVWLLVLLVVASVSALARGVHHRKLEIPGRAGWATSDPDSHHLMHRVAGGLRDGLPLAEIDPELDFPNGSAIPGAPYYPTLVALACAPFAPEDAEERHVWLEMRMASLALVFGVATSLAVAWCARIVAGAKAGLAAGLVHALAPAAIGFSNLGNGDYHAWVGCSVALAFALFTRAFASGALERAWRAWWHGLAIGAALGLALGSWAATTIDIAGFALVLGLSMVVVGRKPLVGLAPLGVGIFVATLAVALPALVASPWQARAPWVVVNLSWFHGAFLLAGALVSAPLFWLHTDAAPERARRAYPWLVAVALAATCAWIRFGDAPLARGVRDGFAWASRGETFMAGVRESQPLFGEHATLSAWSYVGFALALAAPAWCIAVVRVVRRGELGWLPVTVLAPLGFALAASQMRFAGAFVVPLAVLLAATGVPLLERALVGRKRLAWLGWPLAVVFALGAEWSGAVSTWRFTTAPSTAPRESAPRRAARECAEWLRRQHRDERTSAVLAFWTFGHTLQWAAQKPVVASNYGTYVGAAGFHAPAQVFLAPSLDAATPLLEQRRVRWLLVTSDLADYFEPMCAALEASGAPPLPRDARDPTRHDGALWYRSLALRLLSGGVLPREIAPYDRPLARARLVFVSTLRDKRRASRADGTAPPAAYLWERVPGCTLRANGTPGETFEVAFMLDCGGLRVPWVDRVALDGDGRGTLVVPYATSEPNGAIRVLPGARWTVGARSGDLVLSNGEISQGATRQLP
ncbi:MAG: hypothetical protein L6Q99_17950 [Planctomycetes bacterium]|nr:hypothetical protein [Planctomycetota bacterium]